MPLPASANAISFSQVNTELGLSATAQISLNDAAVRSLFGKTTALSAISMSDGHGKSAAFSASITTNQQEMNLRTFAVSAGWNQSSAANITVNSNVYVSSNNTGTAAMTIDGSWPGGVTLTNSGFIMGRGGNGGNIQFPAFAQSGGTGGPAISLGVNCSIVNNSGAFIGGGGGGGGTSGLGTGGGGAGGAPSGFFQIQATYRAAAAGGGVGQAGANGSAGIVRATDFTSIGGGGGRIFPGSGGAGAPGGGGPTGTQGGFGGGAGGGGGGFTDKYFTSNGGGAGGSGGNAGTSDDGGAGGGGWGASGGSSSRPQGTGPAGSGGKAIALNGFTATRSGSGTTFGAVS